jgi:signal transduction histidine kinase
MTFPATGTRFRRMERQFHHTVIGGFALVLVLMVVSGVVGLLEMRRVGQGAEQMSERYLTQTRLVEELERQQGSIGILLYNLADGDVTRMESLWREADQRQQSLKKLVDEANRNNLPSEQRAIWGAVGGAGRALFDELDQLQQRKLSNSPALAAKLGDFTRETTRLMDVSYSELSNDQRREIDKDSGIIRGSTKLMVGAVTLAILGAVFCAGAAIAAFRNIEKQADALARLSVHTFSEQEETARRFSQEMHDEFGQTLNAIESTLTSVVAADATHQERVRDAIALAKESQALARDMSHLMRPRILDDFGLDAGLRELAQGFSRRTGIPVEYRSVFHERLDPWVETNLFRIAQEALTNTARHTMATNIQVSLAQEADTLQLRISDNGGGLRNQKPDTGLGLLGMRERARSAGGRLEILSKNNEGVEIVAEIRTA